MLNILAKSTKIPHLQNKRRNISLGKEKYSKVEVSLFNQGSKPFIIRMLIYLRKKEVLIINLGYCRMRIKLTTFLVISFLINSAQTGRIIGVVFDEDKVSVSFTTVHIQEINKVIYSNSEAPKLNYGSYHLTLKSIGYQPKTFNI